MGFREGGWDEVRVLLRRVSKIFRRFLILILIVVGSFCRFLSRFVSYRNCSDCFLEEVFF